MHKPVFLINFLDEPLQSEREQLLLGPSVQGPGGHSLWTSYGPPADIGRLLFQALVAKRVRSAAFLPDIPSTDLLWLATEWWGALVVHADLAELITGVRNAQWHQELTNEKWRIVVLRPRQEPPRSSDQAPQVRVLDGTAATYRGELYSNAPSVTHISLGEVRQDMTSWFGDLANPNVGGAVALLTLSGARKASDRVLLRNPAALGLTFIDSEDSLAAYQRDHVIQVSGIGTTMREASYHAGEFRAAAEAWDDEFKALSATASRADYVVLLELSALQDPEIVIGEGMVLEQTGFTGAQTLAASRSRSVHVEIGDIIPVALPAWCLNSSLRAPSGEPIRPTPLRFAVSGTQRHIWAEISEILQGSEI
ncbi:hypothetical protein [Kitasatospora sp. NPDC090091]|uniref:hypothetical protein n=1 Tax=Kitasatospora sp. NPDC090091 TaxID=3364081 RepID=UPI00381E6EBA